MLFLKHKPVGYRPLTRTVKEKKADTGPSRCHQGLFSELAVKVVVQSAPVPASYTWLGRLVKYTAPGHLGEAFGSTATCVWAHGVHSQIVATVDDRKLLVKTVLKGSCSCLSYILPFRAPRRRPRSRAPPPPNNWLYSCSVHFGQGGNWGRKC